MDEPRVYLIDDDTSYLQATARMLRLSGFTVAEYASASGFLAELSPQVRGCVVSDLLMPEMDGLELQKRMLEKESLLPIVFLTARGTIPASVQAMRRGAEDFLTKDAPRKQLIAAIGRAFERNVKSLAEQAELDGLLERLHSLTPREHQVLELVAQGRMNKQIAASLGIHERTVKLHRSAGMKKMAAASVAELSVLWQRLRDAGKNS
jgi:FixJ family two-component response regulator